MTTLDYDRFEQIDDLRYKNIATRKENGQLDGLKDVIEVRFDSDDFVVVKNTGFTKQNYALCLLAYLGAKPSDLQIGTGKQVPVTETDGGVVVIPGWVFDKGKHVLEDTIWGPEK